MQKPMMFNAVLRYLTVFGVVLASACQPQPGGEAMADGGRDHGHDHGHGHDSGATGDEADHGPRGGRLLRTGDFALELTVDEAGRPPRWQVYPYHDDQPLPPQQVQAEITVTRLDGATQTDVLRAEGQALVGTEVLAEPHSFDVGVSATYAGRSYRWHYASYEGRTQIAADMAAAQGVTVAPAGGARLTETIAVLGRVDFAPGALVTLRAQFPGRVIKVTKNEGDRVTQGEVLALIEANDSLRAPMDGMVIRRGTNAGDVVSQAALFVIGDARQLRVLFHVYPGDFNRIRPGQRVRVESVDGVLQAHTQLSGYLPTTETATQTVIAYAPLENPDEAWLPGMIVNGHVAVADAEVPLAVRTDAIQRFRDRPVVFARVGDVYEVRMLELGRQNSQWSEVLGGLKPGQLYVTENSYLIKADIEKHGAGHDH